MNRRIIDKNIFSKYKILNSCDELWMNFGLLKYNLSSELYYDGVLIDDEKILIEQKNLYDELNILFASKEFPKNNKELENNYLIIKTKLEIKNDEDKIEDIIEEDRKIYIKDLILTLLKKIETLDELCIDYSDNKMNIINISMIKAN